MIIFCEGYYNYVRYKCKRKKKYHIIVVIERNICDMYAKLIY